MKKLDDTTKDTASVIRYADASALGWPPGHWPLSHWLNTEGTLVKLHRWQWMTDPEGELAGWQYVGGTSDCQLLLTVHND